MLERCYSENFVNKQPTYRDCSVCQEWLSFMTFRAWMISQEWEGLELDKDILKVGNKVYGPDTCVFVTRLVNSFILDKKTKQGKYPMGVYEQAASNKYASRCWDYSTGKRVHLGNYETPEEAHRAWLAFKLEQAYQLALMQTDVRVSKALIDRYENYTTYQ